MSVCPGSSNATVVIGLTQKGFRPGHEPGHLDNSIGYIPSTGRCLHHRHLFKASFLLISLVFIIGTTVFPQAAEFSAEAQNFPVSA